MFLNGSEGLIAGVKELVNQSQQTALYVVSYRLLSFLKKMVFVFFQFMNTIRLLEEITGIKPLNIDLGSEFLEMVPTAQTATSKTHQ